MRVLNQSLACLVVALATNLLSQPKSDAWSPERPLAVTNVTIVPMDTNRLVRRQTLVIAKRRITAMGDVDAVSVPPDAYRIDGTGQFILPGLIDAHVHLSRPASARRTLPPLFMAAGVTSVLNLSGTDDMLRLRSEIGETGGAPRLFTSGPYIEGEGVTERDLEALVLEHKRAGFDFIKLHGDLSLAAYRRMMRAAKREGIRVIGHAPRHLGLQPMLEEGQDAVAHVEEFLYAFYAQRRPLERAAPPDDATVDELAGAVARGRMAVITTLAVFKGIVPQINQLDGVLARPAASRVPDDVKRAWLWLPPSNTYANRFSRQQVPWFERQYALMRRTVAAMSAAGVLLVAGTDTPTASVIPGVSLHDELDELVRAGLTPYQAIRTTTADAARFLGVPDSGTVAVGQRADVLMVRGNPLANIRALRDVSAVCTNGYWRDRTALDALLQTPGQ